MTVLTLILAGGPARSMSALTAERPKPALSFGGKYRVIDFELSNVANSGLDTVAVLAQFNPAPLVRHIGAGRPWDLDRTPPKVVEIWLPGFAGGDLRWYQGSAAALDQNRKLIATSGCDRVLILSADQIYKLDYRALLRFHDDVGADLTIATMHVPPEEAHRFGLITIDADRRIRAFNEKPAQPQNTLASLGFYLVTTEFLLREVGTETRDIGRDLIPKMVAEGRVVAYPFGGSWADIGTVQAYWETNLALLDDPDRFDLADPEWPIATRPAPRPPARLGAQSDVRNAIVSDGCVIYGTVEHSVLSPGVVVAADAVVRDSVIMQDTVIGSGVVVDRCVIDTNVRIGAEACLGIGDDHATPNRREPDNLHTGITLVGPGAHIPDEVVIGRSCIIDPHTTERDYDAPDVPSGESVACHA